MCETLIKYLPVIHRQTRRPLSLSYIFTMKFSYVNSVFVRVEIFMCCLRNIYNVTMYICIYINITNVWS